MTFLIPGNRSELNQGKPHYHIEMKKIDDVIKNENENFEKLR